MINKFCIWLAGIPKDKYLHASIAYLITDILLTIGDALIDNKTLTLAIGFVISTIFFIGKEIYDMTRPNNKFDFGDLLADYIGCFLKMIIYSFTIL